MARGHCGNGRYGAAATLTAVGSTYMSRRSPPNHVGQVYICQGHGISIFKLNEIVPYSRIHSRHGLQSELTRSHEPILQSNTGHLKDTPNTPVSDPEFDQSSQFAMYKNSRICLIAISKSYSSQSYECRESFLPTAGVSQACWISSCLLTSLLSPALNSVTVKNTSKSATPLSLPTQVIQH